MYILNGESNSEQKKNKDKDKKISTDVIKNVEVEDRKKNKKSIKFDRKTRNQLRKDAVKIGIKSELLTFIMLTDLHFTMLNVYSWLVTEMKFKESSDMKMKNE